MAVWNLFCALLLLGSLGFGNSQRKQGRNIAVVSEGKTSINFDCPEEFGYYPHPTDCTQYYVCVFGGALLESCTGGLMYSHELQTCDWPRNVGCDGLGSVSVSSPGGDVRVSVQPAVRAPAREERVRYTVVPTAQPQPVISSRGQSRQLHATVHERVHAPQDIITKVATSQDHQRRQQQHQQQLYAEAEDALPPADEIENDRQQRVYRGQPSTVGQVQRDRDGLRHTNAIPTSSRAEKIGVISFGTQQQQQPVQQYRRLEESNVNTQSHATGASQQTPSGRTLYNGSQHYDPSQYDPYYTLYEDDVELYRDVDYTQQQQYTNNRAQPQQVYRGTPAPISVPVQSTVQEEIPQRNSAYYSTQAQDVYSQNYQDDNYDTQVDDQSNYRQSSRQPSRSPIIAANQTSPQSIIITLSASPGQNLPTTQSPNTTTTTETKNETDSSTPKPSSRFISLSTGFNLRQTDRNAEPAPVTYKPLFTLSSTTNSSDAIASKPLPFSLTRLPNNETKSVVFRLSSRLSTLSPNVSEIESQASNVELRSTESPNKREILNDKDQLPVAHVKSTVSTHVIPTTYSPSKALLASILPKHSDTESFKSIDTKDEEPLVSILPRKIIIVSKPTTESATFSHKESIIVENPVSNRRTENNDKPIKTIIRKHPIKLESTTPFSSTDKTKERKIISKIHFGVPQTYTIPEKINNLATTASSLNSDTYSENSKESSSEKTVYRYRPVSAHYITTDLTTTQRVPVRFSIPESTEELSSNENLNNNEENSPRSRTRILINSKPTTERGNSVKYTPNTFDTEYFDNFEQHASPKSQPKFTFNYNLHPTTERINTEQYSTTEKSSEEGSRESFSNNNRQQNKFSSNTNFRPTLPSTNYVKYSSSTTEKESSSEEIISDESSDVENNRDSSEKQSVLSNLSSTETSQQEVSSSDDSITDNSNSKERVSSNERPQHRYSFNSNVRPIPNYVKYAPSTTDKVSNPEDDSSVENTNNKNIFFGNERLQSRFQFNTETRPTVQSASYVKYTPSSTEQIDSSLEDSSTKNTNNKKIFSFNERLHPRLSFNSDLHPNTQKYKESSTEKDSNFEDVSSSERSPSKFVFNSNKNPFDERRNYNKYIISTSTTEKSSAEELKSYKFLPPTNFNNNAERKHYFKNLGTTDKSNPKYLEYAENSSEEKSTTEREKYFKYSSTTEQISSIQNEHISNSQKPYKFPFISSPAPFAENLDVSSTTEKKYELNNSSTFAVKRKPIFRFVYNPAPTSSTERINFAKYSTTENHDENESQETFKSGTFASTTRPLYQYSTSTTTEHVPSTTTSTSTTFRYSTTTTGTTSTTSNTEHSVNKIKNSFIPSQATEKYRFVQSSSEISDADEQVRSQLFVNRNVKPFRATAELPTVSEILATQDEIPKKVIDSPPTYKPKPFSLTDNQNRTSVDVSRNVTLPVRLSRVNTAIKSLTAFGGTRRNSQSPKCNENQTTPDTKCNEIQKQRTSTRGRGSAHYTSSSAGENLSVNVNRGTPATPRSRPTLKPSTSIVSKASEYVDIYRYPPQRPEAIYPQPQVDKTAAKCRKDVCLLPDCSCGGKDIPGDLPVEQVPQIVLLTFDDSVNDLNKGLYSDLFEKGRTNPNGCPIAATFYVSHEWTDYSQVQNLYSDGHELASHTVSHSFGEQFSQKKWNREVAGQREILAAYGGVHLEDVRGMRAPFLSVGGNKMFKMLYDSNFTYDSSLPVYENRPPSWPYTLDYKLFHDCMIPPCPTRSYPGVWEVPMVMWQDLNGGRCSMGDACSNPPDSEGVYKMLMKNFERHYTTNRAPFGLFYHAAWFTQPHHKEGFIKFLDFLVSKDDVFLVTNWQAIQWVRDPTPLSKIRNFHGFQCNFQDRPKRCNNPKVCNLWHKSGVRYMKTCQPCPDIYPWTGKTGIRSSRIDNDIED